MFNIWPLQWDCSVVVFQFLRRRCWSLNKRATTVSSRLFARKGYVTKSWKCSWSQSLWFRIAKVYFWSCVERLWKFTVSKKSRRPTAQAELSFIFNLLLALQAKCWSDRGRVTIFPQSMLKFPRYSTVATTSARLCLIVWNVRYNVFNLLYAPVRAIIKPLRDETDLGKMM